MPQGLHCCATAVPLRCTALLCRTAVLQERILAQRAAQGQRWLDAYYTPTPTDK